MKGGIYIWGVSDSREGGACGAVKGFITDGRCGTYREFGGIEIPPRRARACHEICHALAQAGRKPRAVARGGKDRQDPVKDCLGEGIVT